METSAHVRIKVPDNATFEDAFKFGTDGDTTWSFTGQKFRMDVKGNREDASPLISFTSDAGQIVVDNAVTRVLHFNVPDATLRAALVPGRYLFDFIMYDTSNPAVRVALMHGTFEMTHGITGD